MCSSQEELLQFLSEKTDEHKAVIPSCCLGRLPLGRSAQTLTYLDLSALSAVIEFQEAEQVITVQSGITLEALNRVLKQQNRWWPVAIYDQSLTVGDVINHGEGGCLEHRFGGPRDLVLGVSVALASGDTITCGGKVVKNVTGYDLTKLFVGSHGWLGLVTSAHLRLYSFPEASVTICCQTANLEEVFHIAYQLIISGIPVSCLELVDGRLADLLLQSSPALAELGRQAVFKEPPAGQTLLLSALHGRGAVVSEMFDECSKTIAKTNTFYRLPQELGDNLWDKLANACEVLNLFQVEVILPYSQMQQLLAAILTSSVIDLWQARPSKGRLKFFVPSLSAVNTLIVELSKLAEQLAFSFPVSYADEYFNICIKQVSKDGISDCLIVSDLKKRLKQHFDPNNILNPLVSL